MDIMTMEDARILNQDIFQVSSFGEKQIVAENLQTIIDNLRDVKSRVDTMESEGSGGSGGDTQELEKQIAEIDSRLYTAEKSIASLNPVNVQSLQQLVSDVVDSFGDGKFFSMYNADLSKASVTTIPAMPITTVGDFLEIRCRHRAWNATGYRNKLNMFNSGVGAANQCGFYSQTAFYLRVTTGNTTYQWTGLSVDMREWHTVKLMLTASGWELFIDGVSQGVKTKVSTDSDFVVRNIIFNTSSALTDPQFFQLYDVDWVRIRSAASVDGPVFYNGMIASYLGSVNVDLVQNPVINPNIMLKFDATANVLHVYQRDNFDQSIYYDIGIVLRSDENINQKLWGIDYGRLVKYNAGTGEMTDLAPNLLYTGESEFVIKIAGEDWTGGIHGQERIDTDASCFVDFLIDGKSFSVNELTPGKMIQCEKFAYRQRSALYKPSNGAVIGWHTKETRFVDRGFECENYMTFTANTQVSIWYFGLVCIHKHCSSSGFNEKMISETLTQTDGSNALVTTGPNRKIWMQNPQYGMSAVFEANILFAPGLDNDNCEQFVTRRSSVNKIYRMPNIASFPAEAGKLFGSLHKLIYAFRGQ